MPVSNPPYALDAVPFRFPALAALAGRSPLGGQREVALATYLAARLAQDVLPGRMISAEARSERARQARAWLSTLALPAAVATALGRLFDASASWPGPVAAALREVLSATGTSLDASGRLELEQVVASLEAQTLVG